nr:DegV family protein [bacterium]
MPSYILFTDSCSDLPIGMAADMDIQVIPMAFCLNGQNATDTFKESQEYEDFYNALRAGGTSVTSQITPEIFDEQFRPYLEQGKDIVYIAFSSALSGTCFSAYTAAKMLEEEFPGRKIAVIDSLCASMGQGLLVYCAATYRNGGMGMEELVSRINKEKMNLNHIFTVDDLLFLKRGGRLSGAAAYLGTLLSIKPVMYVDNQGRLLVRNKVRTRERALRAISDNMAYRVLEPEGQTIFIGHGGSSEDCDVVIAALKELFPGVKEIVKGYIGPVIGSHSGPGTIALFFMGKDREMA